MSLPRWLWLRPTSCSIAEQSQFADSCQTRVNEWMDGCERREEIRTESCQFSSSSIKFACDPFHLFNNHHYYCHICWV